MKLALYKRRGVLGFGLVCFSLGMFIACDLQLSNTVALACFVCGVGLLTHAIRKG